LAERLLLVMGVPYIVDYDDAMFHRYDQHPSILVRALLGRKIDAVMRHADVVVAGNKYLAERARLAGATQIEVIPSVVDAARYKPLPHEGSETPIVGWIGTPMTSRYLKPLIPVFQVLRNEFPVRFVAIGARSEEFEGTPIEARPWSEDTEVQSIQQIDIGIMPLQDSHWERGKCGYKLIQYMACGLPVVASPVGVNTEIVEHGVNGFLASDNARWLESLTALLSDAETRRRMGRKGREKVESWYCLQVQAPRLKRLIYQLTRLSELTISR
jgi:glycosyltransferase involved in cell wall biosynthesis